MHNEIFKLNQKNLLAIPEIVHLLRGQMFFEGNKKIGVLVKNLSEISDYIEREQPAEIDNQEWMLLLKSVLQSQQNRDYILLADVLEGDMLPFLQKLHIYNTSKGARIAGTVEMGLDEVMKQ